ncbi:MAG TPA: hypothetical protein VNA25_04430 [Phycisphaerae bacterium]|nr:hypothetical protein [Phycisphaerae bacterium]
MSRTERDTPFKTGMGPGGCLVRLGWMVLGNVVLLFALLGIVQRQGLFSYVDAVFWAVVGACLLLRYVDIRYLGGLTVTAQPATLAHWYRYALVLVSLAAVAWGATHAIAYGVL